MTRDETMEWLSTFAYLVEDAKTPQLWRARRRAEHVARYGPGAGESFDEWFAWVIKRGLPELPPAQTARRAAA